MTSQTLHSWHQISSLWHHIHSLGHHSTLCMKSSPRYLTSRPLYLYHHTHHIDDITPTTWVILHPVYPLHRIPSFSDIISTKYDITTLCVDVTTLGIYMTSFALQKPLHPLYHTKPQSLWLHIHFRHDITPPISDVAPTVSLSSQPLHWYHTHFCMTSQTISVTSYALYTSYPLLMSSHYSTNDSTSLTYETTSSMQFKIYTSHVTSHSLVCVITPTLLWHHTRHRYSIFYTIEDITSSFYDIIPPILWHHTHYIWHRIDAISVTTSTVLMISHQLYLWDLIVYICWNDIHCIQQHNHYICTITATVPVSHSHFFHDNTPFVYMTSQPLYLIPQPLHMSGHTCAIDAIIKIMEIIPLGTHMTLYTLYITSHSPFMTSILSIYDITNSAFMTSHLLYMTSHTLFRTSHHFMYDIKSTGSDLTSTVSVSSHPPYRWHHSQYTDGITSSISVTSYLLFFWHNIH